MKNVRDWDESDLDRIVQSDQKETTTLDYKCLSENKLNPVNHL
jgi:hypothetical protein